METSPRLNWLNELAEKNILTQKINLKEIVSKNIIWDVLRTDLIHPVCSGNKFFKLKYYLNEALESNKKTIATYGGPWSNHLVATAYAAKSCGLQSIGYVRGEEPVIYSQTLLECMKLGMHLSFIGRDAYDEMKYKDDIHEDVLTIPQGGYGYKGMVGASDMLNYVNAASYSHIICAVGSGTMYAGLLMSQIFNSTSNSTKELNKQFNNQVLGLVVHTDPEINDDIGRLLTYKNVQVSKAISLQYDGIGGFAKINPNVINFMNWFYQKTLIPTDFVYTGRLMKWIYDSIHSGFFPSGSKILAIHSGGLQGNISLKKQTLAF